MFKARIRLAAALFERLIRCVSIASIERAVAHAWRARAVRAACRERVLTQHSGAQVAGAAAVNARVRGDRAHAGWATQFDALARATL